MKLISGLLCSSILALSACGKSYGDFEPGEFQGRLIVEWYEPDLFIFRPDSDEPLIFRGFNREPIQPKTFQTDAGSTPQILRAFKHYSPWGYAKAYIIHDWLFAEHYCGRLSEVSFEESADILSEAIKTMIEADPSADPSERKVLETIDAGVRSTFAKEQWDTGECTPVDETGLETGLGKPNAIFVVE